jgi:hypothetical protein
MHHLKTGEENLSKVLGRADKLLACIGQFANCTLGDSGGCILQNIFTQLV